MSHLCYRILVFILVLLITSLLLKPTDKHCCFKYAVASFVDVLDSRSRLVRICKLSSIFVGDLQSA